MLLLPLYRCRFLVRSSENTQNGDFHACRRKTAGFLLYPSVWIKPIKLVMRMIDWSIDAPQNPGPPLILFSFFHSRSIRRRRQNAAGPNGTLAAGTGGGTTGDTLSVNNEGIVVAAGEGIKDCPSNS